MYELATSREAQKEVLQELREKASTLEGQGELSFYAALLLSGRLSRIPGVRTRVRGIAGRLRLPLGRGAAASEAGIFDARLMGERALCDNNVRGSLVGARRAFQSGNRISDKLLLSKDKFAKNVQHITEARRTIGKADIATERLKFLGNDAVKVGPGKWRSIDGTRQFRVKPNDYLGKHGNIGPHAHFEFLRPNSAGTALEIWKNIHVPLR